MVDFLFLIKYTIIQMLYKYKFLMHPCNQTSANPQGSCADPSIDQTRILTPDLSVYILGEIFIAINSWNNNLAAYGIWIW